MKLAYEGSDGDSPDADPNECIEEPPPHPCDSPDGDPDYCEGEVPPPPPCFEENGDCGIVECENGYDDPGCWPDVDICVPGPNGEFDCDEDIGAAPEFPFPDFGCGEEIPVDEGDLPPPPPDAPEPA